MDLEACIDWRLNDYGNQITTKDTEYTQRITVKK